MEDKFKKANAKHTSIYVKAEPEAHSTGSVKSENSTLENNNEANDLNDDVNKCCRRSKRTNVRNLRNISEPYKQNGTISDSAFTLLDSPSSYKSNTIARKPTCADDSLKQVLIQIGLYDELYSFLKSEGITAEALKYMQIRHIDELFKDSCLNTKIVFEHRLKEWQETNGNYKEKTLYTLNNQKDENIQSKMNSSINGILHETDITRLGNVLKKAVQQAINTTLLEYKNSNEKSSDKSNNYKNKVHNEINTLKKIKTEPNQCADVTVISNETTQEISNNYQKHFKVSDEILLSNQTVDIAISPLPKKRKVESGINIQDILAQSTTCQNLFDEYEKSGLLTLTQQRELVNCIVDFYITHNTPISILLCKEIAENIVQLFATECVETYFIEDKAESPKGILWECYQERKSAMHQSNTLNLSQDTSINDKDDTVNNTDWSNMQAVCSQMKHMNDEKELFETWKTTFAYRRHQLHMGLFSNWKLYFDEFPFCKQQNYALYVESDLQNLYPNLKFNNFIWDDFLKRFPVFFANRVKSPRSKQLFDQLASVENINNFGDYIPIKVFELLHVVLKSHTSKLQSKEETQHTFTVEVSDLSELKKVVIERKKYCTDNNLQAKPYIAVVGQNKVYSHFSVILDSTGFSCYNYKDSLILCFNLFLFFDISFPHESLNVWTFIQKYFFNKPPLVRNARVESFIHEIKSKKTANISNVNSVK